VILFKSEKRVGSPSARLRHECHCQCAIGEEAVSVLPSVSMIESSTAAAGERKPKSRAMDDPKYVGTSSYNLGLVLLRIELQINKIEALYITKVLYFIFWGPSNLETLCGRIARTSPRTPLTIW